MVNEDLKRAFIQGRTEKERTAERWYAYFADIESFENEWNADFCTKSTKDLQIAIDQMFSNKRIGNVHSAKLQIGFYEAYSKWCVDNGVPGAQVGISGVKINLEKNVDRFSAKNPLHFQMFLDSYFEPENYGSDELIDRAAAWLLYSGIEPELICEVRTGDIDLENMVINFRGFLYPIYRDSILSIRYALTATEMQYRDKAHNVQPRGAGDILIRKMSEDVTIHAIRKRMCADRHKVTKTTHWKITMEWMWKSGVFFQAYMREIAGLNPGFTDVIKRSICLKGEEERDIAQKKYRLSKEYEMWKSTF